jgi:hypothetical protein
MPVSQEDLIELTALKWKAQWEGGVGYTLHNWTWRFTDKKIAANPSKALVEHAQAIEEFEQDEHADVLVQAQRDGRSIRQDDKPWGIRFANLNIQGYDSEEAARKSLVNRRKNRYSTFGIGTYDLVKRVQDGVFTVIDKDPGQA